MWFLHINSQFPSPCHHRVSFPAHHQINPVLSGLSLEQNQLGDDGVGLLAEALKTEQNLTFINFQGNQVGDAGAERLASALRVRKDAQSRRA